MTQILWLVVGMVLSFGLGFLLATHLFARVLKTGFRDVLILILEATRGKIADDDE